MAPLNDAQSRTDATLTHLIDKWNSIDSVAMRSGATGQSLLDQIEAIIRRRNGIDAAIDFRAAANNQLNNGPYSSRSKTLNAADILRNADAKQPRIDGSTDARTQIPDSDAYGAKGSVLKASDSAADTVFNATPAFAGSRWWLPSNEYLPGFTDAGGLTYGDEAALNTRDDALQKANLEHFHVDVEKSQAWNPSGAAIPTENGTGNHISTLGSAFTAADKKVTAALGVLDALRQAFERSGEQQIAKQLERIAPVFDQLAAGLHTSADVPQQIWRAGTGANNAFQELRNSNHTIRRAIGDIVSNLQRDYGSTTGLDIKSRLTLHGEFTKLPDVTAPTGLEVPGEAAQKIQEYAGSITKPDVVPMENVSAAAANTNAAPTTATNKANATGSTGGPGVSTPKLGMTPTGSEGPAAKAKANNDLGALLSALGQPAATAAQQASAVPQQAANAAQQTAAPLTDAAQKVTALPDDVLKALRGDTANSKADPAAVAAADTDRAAATSVTPTPAGPAAPTHLGAPGTDARPHQLDANGKPADKDGNGKVDKDAAPLSKRTVKPFAMEVSADGRNLQVKDVPDPRIGEMMLNMAEASGGSPMSVVDAAKASGMDIDSLGDPLDPSDVRVGDAVIGAVSSGIYLGNDLVLTATGLVEGLSDVLGDDGFISPIPLPELPDEPVGPDGKLLPDNPAPVVPERNEVDENSMPATTVNPPSAESPQDPSNAPTSPAPTSDHPAPTAPLLPADAAPGAAAAVPPAPARVSDPAPPAPTAAPLSAASSNGQPTLPRQVPYEGHALG
ncbi:hypothetical protein ABFV47_14395 [Mycolicibacterium fortuitum]|uniref:hypothetical protein n=1 Tax=Mycolicibacterium TaxID=1866885 RepID=UPI003204761B